MQRLLYGITTSVVVTLSDRYYGSEFYLYLADDINADQTNPPSSNPLQMLLDYQDIVRTNDIVNPKFIAHKRAVRRGARARLSGNDLTEAYKIVSRMAIHALQPYLAMLEQATYENRIGRAIQKLSPSRTGSPTSVEYLITDAWGPGHPSPEMHLQRMHF